MTQHDAHPELLLEEPGHQPAPVAPGTAAPDPAADRAFRRTVVGAVIGSVVEFYEFSAYGVLATTMAAVFFPIADPTVALLSSLAVFALAFFARPLGGFFWGPLGDRIGRKRTLALTILLMSGSTLLMGLLPGYAVIGVAAPVLLVVLRFLQGFSCGGEVSGAVSFIAEQAPAARRGFYVSLIVVGATLGTLLGTVVPAALLLTLSPEAMVEWGWRIPFLLALPLGVVAVYIRRRLDETPYFLELKRRQGRRRNPIAAALSGRRQWRLLSQSVLITSLNAASFFMLVGYLPSFTVRTLGLKGAMAFMPTVLAIVTMLGAELVAARLSDRIGRRPVLLASGVWLLVLSWPAFLLITSGAMGPMVAGLVVMGIGAGAFTAVTNPAIIELFSTSVRVTGHGITYNLAIAVFGGSAPYLLTWLGDASGSAVVGAFYIMAVALIAIPAVLSIPEMAGKPLKTG
ncbi:MFS transporter [Pseudonocardia broussonetiae]|uniref:Putative proline/betaine transporter n=1 Tax=Pseudonocardia broussonetiae TaxID=2736640 RepID=A0A6M6JB56_9PSEU|nr:MFS transporter [Pseudonocardia broussonetiae]QJY44776.1 MFS transporter [Pseudonocardia broussonetiae]